MGTKVGYDFVAVPRRRHTGWVGLQNAYGQFLYAALFELADGAPIPFHGNDWRVWLCRAWSLAGKQRAPVCKALDELLDRGLVAIVDGRVSVLFRPEQRHNSSTTQPELGTQQPQLGPNSGRHLESTTRNDSTPEIQQAEQSLAEQSRAEPAPAQGLFRKPLGEPPPGYVEPEPEDDSVLEGQLITVWQKAVGEKAARTPPRTPDVDKAASALADWLVGNAKGGETPLGLFEGALGKYLEDQNKWLVKRGWPLEWMLERMVSLTASVAKPKAAPTLEMHREWKGYSWENEAAQ
jgi:hypothetical protein